ncbi:hypothetical protein [Mucilaginibacter antarcticus]|uniref:hypothetical protein n=1 Tax=Mucilaginibacter antarcticus TaxID=1855725 RepID=UPI003625E882
MMRYRQNIVAVKGKYLGGLIILTFAFVICVAFSTEEMTTLINREEKFCCGR